MEFIDTHTHLDAVEFDDDREAVIERARARGVRRIITIGASDSLDSARRAIALAERYPGIFATAGVHPHDASLEQSEEALELLERLCRHPRVVAVGETGLDFFKELSPRADQERWFDLQIDLAKSVKKPLVIHSRDAGNECYERLASKGASAVGGVFHCFAEDERFASRLLELGFKVSFPGTITFKKADPLRRIVREIPLDQIMIETDAPYMAPEPHRGKRCESSFVVDTATVLATVKGLSIDEVAAQTTKNAVELFNLPPL